MPAQLMGEGHDQRLFEKFSRVAQKTGVYTAADYAGIIGALVEEWSIAGLKGLLDEAAEAQEYLCGLSQRYQRLAERLKRVGPRGPEEFGWIYNRAA